MVIVTYRHRPKRPPRKAQPAVVPNAVVTTRKPKKYQRKLGEVEPISPEEEERLRQFFTRMGLGAAYAKAKLAKEQD